MTTVSLVDVSTYLPGEPIGADYYAQFADTEYSFVSSWQSSTIPSALPTRHLSAGAPLAVLGSVTLFL